LKGGPKAGTPEKKETTCKTVNKDGEKSEVCTTITTPAVPASNAPYSIENVTYEAKVILPDGTHSLLFCIALLEQGCGRIESATPGQTKETPHGGRDANDSIVDSTTTTGLGMFEAKRNKDEIVIFTVNGKRKFHITGSW
jgi:hypothetical protein